jgi:hypothetical protein
MVELHKYQIKNKEKLIERGLEPLNTKTDPQIRFN